METKKAIVFIDGNNFYHNIKGVIKPNKIDFNKVQDILDNCLKEEIE